MMYCVLGKLNTHIFSISTDKLYNTLIICHVEYCFDLVLCQLHRASFQPIKCNPCEERYFVQTFVGPEDEFF